MKTKLLFLAFTFLLALAVISCRKIETTPRLPAYVPANGLVAWWTFTGNGNDQSNKGNNLSSSGFMSYAKDRKGRASSCASFDGFFSYFYLDNPNLPSGNSNRSVSFWFKTDDPIENQTVFCLWGGFDLCHSNFAVLADTGGVYFWGKCEDKNFDTNNGSDWTHIVIVYENNYMKLYKNGVLMNDPIDDKNLADYTFKANLRTETKQLTIGANPTSDFPNDFSGLIDDMGFWNRALTPQEVKNLFNS